MKCNLRQREINTKIRFPAKAFDGKGRVKGSVIILR